MANLKVEGIDVDATGTVDGRDVSVDGTKLDTLSARNNHVLVKVLADFPAPSAGVITLVANTSYQINGTVALLTNRIAASTSNIIYGVDKSDDILTYTGTSNMITCTNNDLILNKITLVASGVGSKILSVSGSGTNRIEIAECILANSKSLGEITGGLSTFVFRNNLMVGNSDGLSFSGDSDDAFFTDNLWDSFVGAATFLSMDSGGTYHTIIISRNMFETVATQTALNLALDLVVTDGGIIEGNSFEGAGDNLIGVDAGTSGWLIPSDSNIGLSGRKFLEPFQLVDATYNTTTDGMGLTTDVYLLSKAVNYHPNATSFRSSILPVWVNHAQSGEDVVVCLADNNAAIGDKMLGFGFTGKFTITDITWQSGDIVRIEFDGKNGETTIDPFDLTRVNVGEVATFEGCTNASNDGTYIITAVNDAGTKYVEVANPGRLDATDDETASPGEAWGGSVCWKTITTAGVYQEVPIPQVSLPESSDIRAGLRRGSISGGNPSVNISNTDVGVTSTEDDGWLTTLNY